jgi:O-antigen ligase
MTSAVGLSILAMYLLVHKFIKRPKIYLAAFIVVYILFFMLIVWYGNSIEEIKIATNFIEGTLSKDTSFSYRTTIWGNAVYKISQSPWIGYGVQNVEWNMTYLDGSGPHNLWLMLLLQGGVSLCSAFVFIVVHIVRHALKTPGYSTTLSVVSICVVFIMSLFETYPIVPIFVLLQFVYYSPLLETTRK